MKLTKEDLDKVRHIEGFPIGKDEDIIALSDPPYYTACPNPFIEDFIKKNGKPYDEETDDYKREPFSADVSEGKNDPIYNAHSYHTKVPHKAIMRYILHYTEPGDIVFDGFCGTGMTGVAAQMCGKPDADKEFKFIIEKEMPNVKWGARKAILNDLSPAATFIAYNYNTPVDIAEFEKEANRILNECEKELGWMYETNHIDENEKQVYDMTGPVKGKINYTVWSDVFICPNCGSEIVLWDVAVNEDDKEVKEAFDCNKCGIKLKKTECERAVELIYDNGLNETISMSKQVPVLINYLLGKKRFEKKPDKEDLEIIGKINNMKLPDWYPIERMIEGSESRRNDKSGITHVHLFYTKRNLYILSYLYSKSKTNTSKFMITACLVMGTKMSRYGSRTGNVSGTLYVPSLIKDLNMVEYIKRKLYGAKGIIKPLSIISNFENSDTFIQTNSLADIKTTSNDSIDYIFTDPPFGDNLMYSELNYIMESWLKVITNNNSEAIINNSKNKGLVEYQNLMTKCFEEYYRVLKPNRWMTVEFHNSKNSVWNAIQESLLRAGFIIADVRTLDKQQGSFKQVTTTSAVKQDLVISAYKLNESFKQRFLQKAGTEETVWDFVREHLDKLPIVVKKGNNVEKVKERESFLLFDRMVAYHIMNGIAVPIDAHDFYKGLGEKFIERDGMYFLHDQINEYDNARIISELEPIQFNMFVNDEKSAISWLYFQLEEPQTYSDIQPKFMKEANAAKYEKIPELGELLEENFLQDEKGRWYIPDPSKSGDIIKLREKRLLKEFDEYLVGKGKLKQFRTEAVRAGFAKLWKNKDYENIVKVGNRLPETVIQEDDKLLMYYDIATSRVE
ncbi:MAG: DNA methyltransferase [Sedimentibacter sp.]